MILNKSQAEAVYGAMCALNNVSGSIKRIRMTSDIVVGENDFRMIRVEDEAAGKEELHASQTEFASAYGLQ